MYVKYMSSKQDMHRVQPIFLWVHYKELKSDQEYYIICQGGGRSATACQFLRTQGLAVTNVEGGMNHWPGNVE